MKNKRSLDVLRECKVKILSEVLDIKSLSPLVKDDSLYILHLLLINCGEWVCNAIGRGIKGVHSEFH